MNKEQFTKSTAIEAYAPAALVNGVNNGIALDTQFFNSFTLPLSINITAGQVDSIKFEQSDDGSTGWAATAEDTDLYYPDDFPLTTAGGLLIHVGTVAKKRYIRVVIVTSNTPTISLVSAVGLFQNPIRTPLTVHSSVIANADINSQGDTGDASSTYPKRPVV